MVKDEQKLLRYIASWIVNKEEEDAGHRPRRNAKSVEIRNLLHKLADKDPDSDHSSHWGRNAGAAVGVGLLIGFAASLISKSLPGGAAVRLD